MGGWGILWLPGYIVLLGDAAGLAEAWQVAEGTAMPPTTAYC